MRAQSAFENSLLQLCGKRRDAASHIAEGCTMPNAIRAGFAYFAIVFAIGFVLGAIRVTIVIPRIGEIAAVCLEAPILLTLAWLICRRIVRRFAVSPGVAARGTMGLVAFGLLMLAELALSITLAGRTPAEHLALYDGLAEQIGLAAQILFAALPLLQGGATAKR
jgi:hypothetical protein